MSFEHDLETLDDAMRQFMQVMKQPQRWNQIIAKAGIDLDRPGAIILKTLLHEPRPLRVQDLATCLGIEPPSITRKTQELEHAGYLLREQDPEDKRAIILKVTPHGKEIITRLWHAQREIIEQVLSSWPADERHQFIELFKRFSSDLDTLSAKQQPKQKDA